ncbi:MAG TPA: AAA family ATPase, partial [Gaiellaceae bacterium]|nr:AAA family ATPase [Gaiellaceae bacterium]
MPGTLTDAPLLERERELAAFDDVLGRVGGSGPRFVLVEGPPGIGKSRLIDELSERAVRAGFGVLTARAAHLEQEFAFGVVRQLFEPVLVDPRRRERLFAGAAASAARVFDVPGSPDAGSVDGSFAALHGLYWLAANLADDAPLLLVVDDLHWCDRPSLRFVAYLARRLGGSAFVLATGLRAGEPGTDPVLVAELASSPEAVRVVPRPLSEPGVAGLIAERLRREPEPEFAAACLDATGGNPLLLRQLLTSLADERVRPIAAEVAAVREIGPRAISRTVLVRLHRLGSDAVAVAQALAVLGDGAEQRVVAGLADATEAEVAAALTALDRAEILRTPAPAAFAHPLVRDAIYHELPTGERAVRHARAAALLAASNAPDEQIATHLLAAPRRGKGWVVDTLAAAAASARAKGAADTAVSFLARALDEPPEPGRRPGLLLELGLSETLTSGSAAAAHLREAWETLEDPSRRARAATILARTLFLTASGSEAAAVARRAAAETPPELVDERQALLATELAAARYTGGTPSAEELEAVRVEGNGPGSKMLMAILSFDLAMSGADAERCAILAEDALADDVLIGADAGFFPTAALIVLTMADREQAVVEWEKLRALVHRRGSLFGIVSVNLWSGLTLLWRGDLRDAQERLEAAHEQFADWGRTRSRVTYGAAFLGDVRRLRGDLGGARAILDTGLAEDDGSDGFAQLLRSRTMLLLEEGRHREALEQTRRLEELDAAIASFPGWVPWRSTASPSAASGDVGGPVAVQVRVEAA